MPNKNLLFFRSNVSLNWLSPSCWIRQPHLDVLCVWSRGRSNAGFKRDSETLVAFFLNSAEHQASLKTLFVAYDMGTFGWLVVIDNFNKVPVNSNRIDTQRVKILPEMAFQCKGVTLPLLLTDWHCVGECATDQGREVTHEMRLAGFGPARVSQFCWPLPLTFLHLLLSFMGLQNDFWSSFRSIYSRGPSLEGLFWHDITLSSVLFSVYSFP